MHDHTKSYQEAFLKILKIFPAPVIIHDFDRLRFVNKAFLGVIHAESEDLVIGSPVLDFVHPEDVGRTVNSLNLPYDEDVFSVRDLHCVDLNGKDFFVDFVGTNINIDGKHHLMLMFQDTTKMFEARDRAAELERLKKNFLLAMSHELRTPMVGLIGFGEELSHYDRDPEIKHMGEMIFASARRLATTFNHILEFSNLESGKYTLRIEDFDLLNVISEVCSDHLDELTRKPVTLNCKCRYNRIILSSDRFMYKRVIENIINNAVKFTPEGEVFVDVFPVTSDGTNTVHIAVSDNGPGIDSDKIGLMFEDFRQVSEGMSREYEGNGLGLTIVKYYLQLTGAKIYIRSLSDTGSVFTIRSSPATEFVLGEPSQSDLFWSSDHK